VSRTVPSGSIVALRASLAGAFLWFGATAIVTADEPAIPPKAPSAQSPSAQTPPAQTPPAQAPPAQAPAKPTEKQPVAKPGEKPTQVTRPDPAELEKRRAAAREALANRTAQTQGKVDPSLSATNSRGAAEGGTLPTKDIAPQQPASSESQVIRFEPTILDLGEMTAEVAKTASVKVVNISDKPVVISRVVPSCGCTTAPAPKDPIPVGGSVEIPITLKPGPKQGVKLSKRVTFQLENEAPVVLTIEGNVAEYVLISPELLTAEVEDAESGKITLTSKDGSPFRILAANPSIVNDISPESKTEHVVHVDWAAWQNAGSGIKLAFSIDHPKISSVSAMIKRKINPADRAAAAERAAQPVRPVDANLTALIDAARKGDVPAMESAIAAGAKVTDVDRATGRDALHWAAREGKVESIDLLVKAGADIKAQDRTGKTALGIAAEAGRVDAVKTLLKAGSDVNHRDRIQGSALLWASGLGNAETVKTLIDAGADPKVADINGLTPLLWAAGIGEPNSVKTLLDAKADMAARDRLDGDDALIRACRTGKDESVKLLLARGAKVDAKNDKGATALLVAAASGSVEKIRALVEAKADLSAKDNSGRSALDYAKNRIDPARDAVTKYLEEAMAKPQ